MLRTKIVCTIGPASRDPHILEEMIRAGMDVARLNFSHGTHALHAENVERIRGAAMEVGRPVSILADLQGPKLRVGDMGEDGVMLTEGTSVTITTEQVTGTEDLIPLQFEELTQAIAPGDRILLDDGLLELKVEQVNAETAQAEVVIGGVLKSNKGFNLPRTPKTISSITEKDKADLQFALEQQVDWIALSFVRTAEEVMTLKEMIRGASAFGRPVPVIAKIEKPEAIDNIDSIIEVVDGIMVARGDLAIETSTEEVPMIQKMLIQKCNRRGKPVITATQMLDSMMHNPRPTRAEASDVANAILDGTDAVMLSGETAAGDYPLRTVQTMAKIAATAEQTLFKSGPRSYDRSERMDVAGAVAHATVETAIDLHAAAIIAPTMSGSTARLLSKYRPPQLVIATTPSPMVQRQLVLHWGVVPLLAQRTENTDEMIDSSIQAALEEGLVSEDDIVVLTAGTAGSPPGSTDLMKVHVIRRRIGDGTGIGNQIISGRVRKLESPVDPNIEIESDEIIVTSKTDRSFIDIAQRAAGLLAEQEGLSSHSAILAVELGLAAIVGVQKITAQVEDGEVITLDTRQGIVYEGRAV